MTNEIEAIKTVLGMLKGKDYSSDLQGIEGKIGELENKLGKLERHSPDPMYVDALWNNYNLEEGEIFCYIFPEPASLNQLCIDLSTDDNAAYIHYDERKGHEQKTTCECLLGKYDPFKIGELGKNRFARLFFHRYGKHITPEESQEKRNILKEKYKAREIVYQRD